MSKQTKLKFCRQGNKDKWEDLEYIYLSNPLNGLLGLSPLGGGRTFVLEIWKWLSQFTYASTTLTKHY